MFKKMIHRKALLRCLFFGALSTALLVALGVTITKNNENETSAASGLTLNVGNYVYVYDVHYKDGGTTYTTYDYTHKYSASGFTDGSHGIFCVEPLDSTPANGTQLQYSAVNTSGDSDGYKKDLQLLLFIYRYYDKFDFIEKARKNIMESSNTEENYNYFWVHMLASWLMSSNGYTDVWPSYYPWQNVADYYGNRNNGWFWKAENKLRTYINNNDILWRLAKRHTLYKTTNTSQTLMFIGASTFDYGTINIQKACDNSTGGCDAIAGDASLEGMKFRISNASGETIYNFSNGRSYADGARMGTCTTNAEGKCSFENLPAAGYKYKIEEIDTNDSYELTAPDQEVTLDASHLTYNLTFKDLPQVNGRIKVRKCDKMIWEATSPHECVAQGNASRKNIQFTLYKVENGNEVVVGTKNTNASGYAEFNNLDIDSEGTTYRVKETGTNVYYELTDNEAKETTLKHNERTKTLYFYDNPVLGSITINKTDSETGTCETSKGGSFAGTTFAIINKSNNAIKYGDQVIDPNGTITTIVFSENTCDFTINNLPYGKYQVKETKAAPGYKKASPVTITIPTENSVNVSETIPNDPTFEIGTKAADADDEDNYVEADGEAKIIDHVEYCARAGKEYTIRGILIDKETEKPVTVNGKTVESSIKITPQETCGRVDMEFIFDGSELGGHDVVVFETLYEEGEDGEDEPVVSHEDIEDKDQTVHMVYIHTTAVNDEDESKVLPMNEDVVIKDTVDYCLEVGELYTIRGVLMDRDENAPLLINGEMVQSEVAVTPEERCGQAVMYFHINTTGLSGKRLVVFESLYLVGEPDKLIIKHEDIYNYDESIDVEPEVPDTGITTRSGLFGGFSNGTFAIMGGVVIVSLGGYLFTRYSSKKNAMKF